MSQVAHTAMTSARADAAENLSCLLTRAAAQRPEARALVHGDRELTYADLEQRSRQAATLLVDLGVGPGDRVGLQLPNVPAFVALYFGILRLGATVVPQNPLATRAELDQSMGDAGARLLLRWPTGDQIDALDGGTHVITVADDDAHRLLDDRAPQEPTAPVRGEATAVILYTSGTTGVPKGAELTHSNLVRNAHAAIEIYALSDDDVVLAVLPLYHSYGQTCTLNGAIAVHARIVLVPRFDATGVANAIDRHSVTVFPGVPTMFSDLAHTEVGALDSLRLCAAGGAALPPDVREHFERRAGAPLLETYGLSETSPIASINRRNSFSGRRAGTVGWPIAGTEMRIVDEQRRPLPAGEVGEIAIRGHNVMKGYWGNPEATGAAIDPEGWFHSGDLGTMDEDGCFTVVGRLKDLIIRGGHNVYPAEIEHLLDGHPAVRLAAVVGIPDERLGEEVAAAVWLESNARVTPEELREWARERLAPQKYPRHIRIVEELPLGPTGKVLKREIAPRLVEELRASADAAQRSR